MAFEQAAVDADDQLLGAGAVLNPRRPVDVEDGAHAGPGIDALVAPLDQLLAADGHLDQGEGIEVAGFDGDVAAIAHAADADTAQALVVDAGKHRTLGVHAAQTVLAEDPLAPLARFLEVMRTAQLVPGQHHVGRHCGGKVQAVHVAPSTTRLYNRAGNLTVYAALGDERRDHSLFFASKVGEVPLPGVLSAGAGALRRGGVLQHGAGERRVDLRKALELLQSLVICRAFSDCSIKSKKHARRPPQPAEKFRTAEGSGWNIAHRSGMPVPARRRMTFISLARR
ncbi:hypothetical protein D9M71_483730 [compost metagenome]